MDNLPNVILILSVSLMIFAVGFFAFFYVYTELEYSTEQIESFAVTDPTTDETVTLSDLPTSITLVEQYNGFEWKEIPSAGYTQNENQVTVDSAYLEG